MSKEHLKKKTTNTSSEDTVNSSFGKSMKY